MTELSKLKLYATHSHPCSYLESEQAATLFVDPDAELDAHTYSALSQFGFRRSGLHVYRPRCENCQACIPIRVIAPFFRLKRNHKKCLKRNNDLQVTHTKTIDPDAHYALYEKYINLRHSNGDMYPPSKRQFEDFLCSAWGVTEFLEFRKADGALVAVAVADVLGDGISAMYTYFDPNEEKRSLGVFAVLYQISWARSLELPYIYLGYWIKESQKMRYKSDYKPHQLFVNNRWVTPKDQESV